MTPTLEQSLRDLCAAHDLTCISFCLNLDQIDQSAFNCTVHWGGSAATAAGCAIEHGATIPAALTAVLASAMARRTVNHAPLIADIAIVEEVA